MSEIDLPNFDTAAARQALTARLDRFRRHVRGHAAVAGAARAVLLAVGLIVLSYLIDRTFRLSFPVRMVLLAAGIVAVLLELWRSVLLPLLKQMDYVPLADAVDRAAGAGPRWAPRVATVLELENHAADAVAPSAVMVRAAVGQASQQLDGVQWSDYLDDGRLRRHTIAIVGAILALLILATASYDSAGLWVRRWLAGSNEPWPQKTYLAVAGLTDGRLLVPRGESATVLVRVKAGSLEPKQITLTLRPATGNRVDSVMTRFAPGDFRQDLPPVNTAETIEVAGGDEELDPITVEPVDRPRIEKLQLISQHPLDPSPITHDFAGDSTDLTFLPQTALRLRLQVSAPLDRMTLGEKGVVANRIDDRTYEIVWKHTRAMNFQIELTAARTGLTSVVTPLSIGLLTDQPPRVTLAYTSVRQRITPQATIPLNIDARDDYGIHDASLLVKADWLDANQQRQTTSTTQPLYGPEHPANEKELQLPQQVSVGALHAPVGALVTLTAVANDERYDGPQAGKSKEATFRLVSPEELFREILLRQQSERAKFRKSSDEASAIRGELATMASAEAATGLARRHRALQREVERITSSLADSLTEMRLNALGTAETHDLMQRTVIEPLKTLSGGLITQQRDALDAMSAGGPIDAVSASQRQDQIVEQMNAILKQMAQWDSFVDVLNQLNEIIRLQEQAKQKTDHLHKAESDSVFDK